MRNKLDLKPASRNFFLGLFIGFLSAASVAGQINYQLREKNDPSPIKQKLTELRRDIQNRNFTFTVGYTEAMDEQIKN